MAARICVVVCAAILLASCGGSSDDEELLVFAAASLSGAFNELASAFEEMNPDVSVQLNFAGSSSLREQVLAGAPADVVALANPATMEALIAASAVDAPVVIARNEVLLGVPADNPADVADIGELANNPGLFVGVCAVDVPCGQAARALVDRSELEILFDSEEPDARALATKLAEAEFDAAFVYRSDVVANDRIAEVPLDAAVLESTEYPLAVTADADDLAMAFAEFVLSDDGQAVLIEFGFAPAEASS